MSLSPREREALGEIEIQLSRSDPRLAAMLGAGATRRSRWRPARNLLRWSRTGPGELARFLIPTVGLALVVALAVAGVLSTHPARSPGPGRHPAGAVVPTGVPRFP
jgi:hypothetical protein